MKSWALATTVAPTCNNVLRPNNCFFFLLIFAMSLDMAVFTAIADQKQPGVNSSKLKRAEGNLTISFSELED